jgi:hypothetical protein
MPLLGAAALLNARAAGTEPASGPVHPLTILNFLIIAIVLHTYLD